MIGTAILAFVCAAVLAIGGRAQGTVAHIASRNVRPLPLLIAALTSAGASVALAAWAGAMLADLLARPGRMAGVGLAFIVAAIALIRPARVRDMAEPTRASGAIALVLLMYQLAAASTIVLFAMALSSGDSTAVMAGGVLGAGVATASGWLFGSERLQCVPIATIRALSAGACLVAGAAMVWRALASI